VLERDVLPCNPDAVVLLFTSDNDIADINPATASAPLRPFPRVAEDGSVRLDMSFAESRAYRSRVAINPLKQSSALVSLMAERYNAWNLAPPTANRAMPRDKSLCTAAADSAFVEYYAMNKRLMTRVASECADRGVNLWLMAVPVVRRAHETAELRALDPTFDPVWFDRDLAALADSIGAGFIPLQERFAAAEEASGEPLFWAHWSYAGHRVAAAALVEAMLPPSAPADAYNHQSNN
jgi:hypothetical protein